MRERGDGKPRPRITVTYLLFCALCSELRTAYYGLAYLRFEASLLPRQVNERPMQHKDLSDLFCERVRGLQRCFLGSKNSHGIHMIYMPNPKSSERVRASCAEPQDCP